MSDGLPDEAVRRTRRCPSCGELTDRLSHCFVKGPPMFPQLDSDTATEPVDVVVLSALPACVLVSDGKGTVTPYMQSEAATAIHWASSMLAALSATDTEENRDE
ncbi:MAG TPA: hypothetical protein VN213_18305 [Solirubrobacteraceae bacterium]|nr:hypothetical protein [Solirubrobacteraceae bacterium]